MFLETTKFRGYKKFRGELTPNTPTRVTAGLRSSFCDEDRAAICQLNRTFFVL